MLYTHSAKSNWLVANSLFVVCSSKWIHCSRIPYDIFFFVNYFGFSFEAIFVTFSSAFLLFHELLICLVVDFIFLGLDPGFSSLLLVTAFVSVACAIAIVVAFATGSFIVALVVRYWLLEVLVHLVHLTLFKSFVL